MQSEDELLRQKKYQFAKYIGSTLYNERYGTALKPESLTVCNVLYIEVDFIEHQEQYKNYIKRQLQYNKDLQFTKKKSSNSQNTNAVLQVFELTLFHYLVQYLPIEQYNDYCSMDKKMYHNMSTFFKTFLSDAKYRTQVLERMKQEAGAGLYNSCQTNYRRAQCGDCGAPKKIAQNTIDMLIGYSCDPASYNPYPAPTCHTRSKDNEIIDVASFEYFYNYEYYDEYDSFCGLRDI